MDGAHQLVSGAHELAVPRVAAHREHVRQAEGVRDLGGVEGRNLGVGLLPDHLAAVQPRPLLALGHEALVLHVSVEGEDDRPDALAGLVVDIRGESDALPRREGVLFHLDPEADGALPTAAVADLLSLHGHGILEGDGGWGGSGQP